MSRHPHTGTVHGTVVNSTEVAEQNIDIITVNAVPKAMTMEEIQSATREDDLLQKIIKALNSNNWGNIEVDEAQTSALQSFAHVKQELTAYNGILLRDSHIVIPEILQKRVIQLVH